MKTMLDGPDEAIRILADALDVVGVEHDAPTPGRILATALRTDRPSPACDVSAMDGYAVRRADLRASLPVAGEVRIGVEPPPLPDGASLRIVTGAPIPAGADAVIKREDVEEHPDRIELGDLDVVDGQHIRRLGENGPEGSLVVEAGARCTPPVAGALATFGVTRVELRRRVRCAILVTGDELVRASESPTPWQVRDSNGEALVASLDHPWLEIVERRHAIDEPDSMARTMRAMLEASDMLFCTGGVSMGDRDFVGEALTRAGCRPLFHKVKQRPGKPVLGAIGPDGQGVLALPGNPVSVMVTARRIGLAACARRAGWRLPDPVLVPFEDDGARIPLHWQRPVTIEHGVARPIPTKGSGDVVATARSDGFVECAPDASGETRPFHPWIP